MRSQPLRTEVRSTIKRFRSFWFSFAHLFFTQPQSKMRACSNASVLPLWFLYLWNICCRVWIVSLVSNGLRQRNKYSCHQCTMVHLDKFRINSCISLVLRSKLVMNMNHRLLGFIPLQPFWLILPHLEQETLMFIDNIP